MREILLGLGQILRKPEKATDLRNVPSRPVGQGSDEASARAVPGTAPERQEGT